MEISFAQIEKIKVEGNNFYRAKKIQEAKSEFSKGIALLEKEKDLPQEFQQIYSQLLTNLCLIELSFKQYDLVITYCTKALELDKNNIKALYRRAQAKIGSADMMNISNYSNQREFLKGQLDMYENAKKDLEDMIMIDSKNQLIKDMFRDVFKKCKNLENALGIKKEDSKEQVIQAKKTIPISKEEIKNETKKPRDKNSQATKSIKTEYLEEITKTAVNCVINELIKSNELPQTATLFEKNVNAFKSSIPMLFYYLQKISQEHIQKIYKKKDIPLDTLLKIVETIKETGIKEDKMFCQKFLIALTETYQFDLLIMMLSKKDYSNIWAIIDSFENDELTQQLKKIFKYAQ